MSSRGWAFLAGGGHPPQGHSQILTPIRRLWRAEPAGGGRRRPPSSSAGRLVAADGAGNATTAAAVQIEGGVCAGVRSRALARGHRAADRGGRWRRVRCASRMGVYVEARSRRREEPWDGRAIEATRNGLRNARAPRAYYAYVRDAAGYVGWRHVLRSCMLGARLITPPRTALATRAAAAPPPRGSDLRRAWRPPPSPPPRATRSTAARRRRRARRMASSAASRRAAPATRPS